MSGALRTGVLVLALALFPLAGCDNTETPTTAGTAAGAAAAPADPGKAVSKANELVGAWYRDGATDETIGIEFAADGKLTVLSADGRRAPSQQTVDYALLEDGRLRLTMPGNASMTQVFQCSRNGTALTIALETSGFADGIVEGTYSKLDGKTIVARYGEVRQENQARRAAIANKVNDFVNQPGLAIVPADGGGPGSLRVALNVKGAPNSWSGTGYLEVAGTTFERQVQLGLGAFDPNSDEPITLLCQLGAVTGPPGARQVQPEQFQFNVVMKGDTLDIRDGAARVLRVDTDASSKLAAAYAAGVKKQREMIDAAHTKLGALVLAELRQPNNPRPQRIALMRVADKDQYQIADLRNSAGPLMANSFQAQLGLVLQNDETFLASPQMPGQAYRVSSDGNGLALESIANNMATQMTVTRTFSAEQLAAKRAEVAAFVAGLRDKPAAMVGQFYQSFTYENGYVRPVRLELASPDGKTLGGTFHADALGLDLPIRGTISESVLGLVLNFEVVKNNRIVGFDEGGNYTADLQLENGKPIFLGQVKPGDGANRLELASPSPDRTAELKKHLDAKLAAGGTFKWARTGGTGGSLDVMTLTLQTDADGKITGTAGFRKSTAPLAGKLVTEDGIVMLDLTIPETPPKTVATGTMRLWVVPYGDTFYLSGIGRWAPTNESRFICYGPTE